MYTYAYFPLPPAHILPIYMPIAKVNFIYQHCSSPAVRVVYEYARLCPLLLDLSALAKLTNLLIHKENFLKREKHSETEKLKVSSTTI